MIYKTKPTQKGNIGVSYVSQKNATEQALEMDSNSCVNCYNCFRCSYCSDCSDCSYCSYCSDCSDCSYCSDCSDCSDCLDCSGCSDCSYCSDCSDCLDCLDCSGCLLFVNGKVSVTAETAVENLDRVRAIIIDDAKRLEMGHWHQNSDWQGKTCAEEVLCNTTHCLAGWLQVCSTDSAIRANSDPQIAGALQAPIAAKMFFREPAEVLAWMESRAYVQELGVIEK